jgi:hypothetical protein
MKFKLLLLSFILSLNILSQQVPDTTFSYVIKDPAYESGRGPVIMLDNKHYNFHTLEGRYKPFGKLLADDGYVLKNTGENFNDIKECRILVISNALDSSNITKWTLPTPSAFTSDEIVVIKKWVEEGGRLFIIADHMPFAGAAYELGLTFGIEFQNGFAVNKNRSVYDSFIKAKNTLSDNEITKDIDTILSFMGSAFKIPPDAKPILNLDENFSVLSPETAWDFKDSTPKISGAGLFQGAYMNFGQGKIVVFGEAAMFSAQIAGSGDNVMKVGFNHPAARNNIQFLLNVIHWLDK